MFPDGFIGDDPTSRRNARWLVLFLLPIVLIALCSCTTPQPAGPDLWRIPGIGSK
jgi:hypothetical protein